ncbi:MAG: hypothetical protein PHE61_01330 [Candidatus Omnitrophica bacterium]|nr:hypothetical protein [Candidatus Omnitrophota bacterium]
MGIEEFPEIETFQKLPKRLIVKGGDSTIDAKGNAVLSGIVINNLGQPVQGIKVYLVVFDDNEIPVFNVTTVPFPDVLPQGRIASFRFSIPSQKKRLENYYLYANWKYEDTV